MSKPMPLYLIPILTNLTINFVKDAAYLEGWIAVNNITEDMPVLNNRIFLPLLCCGFPEVISVLNYSSELYFQCFGFPEAISVFNYNSEFSFQCCGFPEVILKKHGG
jgi:hypothetical protein